MNQTELEGVFKNLIVEYGLKGAYRSFDVIKNGNINDTYVIATNDAGREKQYIVQRVNHQVFKNPVLIAENARKVTAHIERKLRAQGCPDIRRRVLKYYVTREGAPFYIGTDGDYWRVISYVFDSVSYNTVSEKVLYSAGRAFGNFQQLLSDFPAAALHETIPDFHNTKKRFQALHQAAAEDRFGRLAAARAEYEYLCEMEKQACKIQELAEAGLLPLRVVHNDTKCNNVMFDRSTDAPLAVIDLDTVMPGLVAHDFGDAVRFAANTAAEDEADLSLVSLSLSLYAAFAKGFLEEVGGALREAELQTLPDGVLTITLELAARFLTDYLEGDRYFKIQDDAHNLRRTRCQSALARNVSARMPELREMLYEVAGGQELLQNPIFGKYV